jgi:3-oxoacyl-[acyl-carrier protein] reductase
MNRFSDRSVLVTGASRGLGRTIAARFAAEGAVVHVGYRARVDEAAATVEAIAASGGRAHAVSLDVTDPASVEAALAEVSAHGPIDVLVNNAAIVNDGHFGMMSREAFEEVIAVDLVGVFTLCRAVARPMMARKRGAIVNVASVAGLRASPGQANYAAAKAGVVGLTQPMAAELGRHGVRVNAVAPGFLDTGMARAMDRKQLESVVGATALRRVGTGDEVASAVLFLASDEASYVVGHVLVVDGGLSL